MHSVLPVLFCHFYLPNPQWSVDMRQILITCREAIVAAIPLIPIFWLLYRYKLHNKERCILYLGLAIYLAAMYATVGLPDITYYRYSPRFLWNWKMISVSLCPDSSISGNLHLLIIL